MLFKTETQEKSLCMLFRVNKMIKQEAINNLDRLELYSCIDSYFSRVIKVFQIKVKPHASKFDFDMNFAF